MTRDYTTTSSYSVWNKVYYLLKNDYKMALTAADKLTAIVPRKRKAAKMANFS